jgi:hypothetical protein
LILRQLLNPFLIHINKNYNENKDYNLDVKNPETPFFLLKIWITVPINPDQKSTKKTQIFFRKKSKEIINDVNLFIPIMSQINPEILMSLLRLKKILKSFKNKNLDGYQFDHKVIDLLEVVMELDAQNFVGNRLKKDVQQLMNLDIIYKSQNP